MKLDDASAESKSKSQAVGFHADDGTAELFEGSVINNRTKVTHAESDVGPVGLSMDGNVLRLTIFHGGRTVFEEVVDDKLHLETVDPDVKGVGNVNVDGHVFCCRRMAESAYGCVDDLADGNLIPFRGTAFGIESDSFNDVGYALRFFNDDI